MRFGGGAGEPETPSFLTLLAKSDKKKKHAALFILAFCPFSFA
jgi:hypothetical protein